MPKRRARTLESSTFLTVALKNYNTSIGASISHEARDPPKFADHVHVYDFASSLELEGVCTYPDERAGESYLVTLYTEAPSKTDPEATLRGFQARNADGSPRFRRIRGQEVPVYDVPRGLGLLERARGSQYWTGWVWVSGPTLSQMLTLVTSAKPLFLEIHERRTNRVHWINGVTLTSTDPAAE